jgi:hypothetical protein
MSPYLDFDEYDFFRDSFVVIFNGLIIKRV